MFLDPHVRAAIADQHRAELIAAAQHACALRLAKAGRTRPRRLRLWRAPRLTGVLAPPVPRSA